MLKKEKEANVRTRRIGVTEFGDIQKERKSVKLLLASDIEENMGSKQELFLAIREQNWIVGRQEAVRKEAARRGQPWDLGRRDHGQHQGCWTRDWKKGVMTGRRE